MRIILDTVIDNDDLPLLNKYYPLMSDSLMAGYGMLNEKDFSGNGNHFSWNGSFGKQGANLLNDTDHIITTPVMEQNEMSMIICCNLTGSNNDGSLVNNFRAIGSAFQGSRLVKLSNSNSGQFNTATGLTSPNTNPIGFGISGAWTVRVFNWNNSLVQQLDHSGGSIKFDSTSRQKNISYGYYVNGVPAGVNAGGIIAGIPGTLGFLAFYKEVMTPDMAKTRMDAVADIMLDRGVVVP